MEIFHIVNDDDGHYFIIPMGKDALWEKFLSDPEMPYMDLPKWAIPIDSYSSVYFMNYTL